MLDEPANEWIERLVEEDLPTEHGWLRSRWSCKLLAVELLKERAALVSRETVGRVLHHLGFRWRRLRPVPPEKGSEEQQEQKRARLEDVLLMAKKAGSFFQDETKLSTGRFHWVVGERKNDELFMKLLEQLRRIYRDHRHLHLALDNAGSHTSKRVERYIEDCGGRLSLHPLPAWSPQSNPVELIWWGLHEAVSRNHNCEELSVLVQFAEGYLEERQPFRLQLGEDYKQLERSPP